MTKKAQFDGEDVEYVRLANPNDPGFDPTSKVPLALIRDVDGKKYVVPANELLLYASNDAEEEPSQTTVKQGPPPEKAGKERRK